MSGRCNYLVRMAFCGAAYSGFQVQKNAPTVCAVFQDALEQVYGERLSVKGCSRTDAGVHAREFCISFFAPDKITPEKLPLALNRNLPEDIRAYEARRVPDGFHARYSALGKEYVYVILNSAVEDVFAAGLSYRVAGVLDVKAMQEAAGHFVGRHDFAAFMAAGSSVEDTVRTVTKAAVECEGNRLEFTVAADGFLYNMVRIMAGTLLCVGRGKMEVCELPGVLASCNRERAGETLPARGLFLNRVFYPQEG